MTFTDACRRWTAVAVLSTCFSAAAVGQTTLWNGSTSAAWNNPANWSSGVPHAALNATIPTGTPNVPSTAGAAASCLQLNVHPGAALTLGAGGPLAVHGNLTVNGAVGGVETLSLVSPNAATLSGGGSLSCALTLDKTGGGANYAATLTVNGAFTLLSGYFILSTGSVRTLTVNGSATLAGGELTYSSLGVLDVNGDVVCAGTTCTFAPTIRCAGNWTGHPAFAPTVGGTTTFDGAGPQTIAGPATFVDLTIAAGRSVAIAGAATTHGATTVSGALDTSAATFDCDGALTVATGGAWHLGAASAAVGGSVAADGPLTGTGAIVMDGASTANLSGSFAIPHLAIDCQPGGVVSLTGDVAVTGALALLNGYLLLSVGGVHTLSVGGDASLSGGELSYSWLGELDVDGDVVCTGTVCTFSPTIRCAGNWTGHAAFAPSVGGATTLDGAGPRTIAGPATFVDLIVAAGCSAAVVGATTTHGATTVFGAFDTSAGAFDCDGALTVATGGAWHLGAASAAVGGSVAADGPLTGTGAIVMDGASTANLSGSFAIPRLTIDCQPGGVVSLTGDVAVTGALALLNGYLLLSVGGVYTLSVGGDASLSGGELTYSWLGELDVDGDVVCAGTVCTFMPDFDCGGHWTGHPAFAPTTGGTLTFDGGGAKTLVGHAQAPAVIVAAGTRTATGPTTIATPTLTVAAGAQLRTGAHPLTVHFGGGPTAFAVHGVLEASAGGVLGLGPQTTATIHAGATLRLPGQPGFRATIDGVPSGGYGLNVFGTINAKNCDVLRPGTNGLVVDASATLAPAPNDLRAATFDYPAGPGAALLTIARNAPTNLRYAEFRNTAAVAGAFGVSCTSGAPVSFTNWSGALSGPASENDPGNRVSWNAPEVPTLAFLGAVPGVGKATLLWGMGYAVDTSGYRIERSDGGPVAFVAEPADVGAGAYNFVDQPLTPNQTYTYFLYAHLTHGPLVSLGSTTVAPFFAPPPSNVLDVGGGGPYATPQAAIDFAVSTSAPITILRVAPGIYPAFTVTATPPGGLRIFADQPGAVIDTSAGPVTIQNLGPADSVLVSGLQIGSATTAGDGLRVLNCACPVIVDDGAIAAAPGHVGARVTASFGAVLQRTAVTGGLVVEGASNAAVNGGAVDSLTVQGASTLRTCGVAPASVSVDGTSTRVDFAGAAAELDAPLFTSIGTPGTFDLQGFPNAPYAVFASFGPGYLPFVASFIEMPVLVDVLSLIPFFEIPTDGAGFASLTLIMPSEPAFLGFPLSLQGAAVEVGTGQVRLSNYATVVATI
jgi:hypothetical protein